ncbi:MAG: copper homeostasis protein CutC [Verrucomicrobiota bacterium]|nr:copper homeostasis protein CutC [Verrucomicrobiota bacterium]
MVKVEACISGGIPDQAMENAREAFEGGAETIELCAAMEDDGLTPPVESIAAARRAFPRNGLMVMIRPRAGDFVYTENEIREMEVNIASAAAGGADGVVFGVITENGLIDEKYLQRLIQKSQSKGVSATFHRAFDVLEDRFEGLEVLIDHGVDRILTSGVAWGCSGGALEGKETLKALVEAADGRIEIVIGGSVSSGNAKEIVSSLGQFSGRVSLHAHSGVQENGVTAKSKVRALREAANR